MRKEASVRIIPEIYDKYRNSIKINCYRFIAIGQETYLELAEVPSLFRRCYSHKPHEGRSLLQTIIRYMNIQYKFVYTKLVRELLQVIMHWRVVKTSSSLSHTNIIV